MPQGPVPYGTTLDSLARHSVDKRQRNRNKRWHTTLIMHTAPIDTTMATKAVYGDLLDDLIMEGDGEEELHILEHPLLIHYQGRRPHAAYAAATADFAVGFAGGVRLAGV